MTRSESEQSKIELKVQSFLDERNIDAAIAALEDARSKARARHDCALASDLGSWIASLHLSEGRVVDALREFESAETDEPANMYHKLNTAMQLLRSGRALDAIHKLETIADSLPDNPSTQHQYHALRGEAQLRLGHYEEAINAFEHMSDPTLIRAVMPVSLETDLAALLLKEGIARERCLEYLKRVKAKAESRNDVALLQRVATIERAAR